MADITADGMGFRVGHVLTQSFSIFFRNIAPFGLLALVLTSPTYLYQMFAGIPDFADFETLQWDGGVSVLLTVIELLLGYLVTAALVYGTLEDLRGNKVSVGDCFSQGLARMFPVAGVAIVTMIVTGMAFALLVIPGLIVTTMLWVTIPVAVVERRGLGSLSRSAELTKGYRWPLFGLLVIMFVIIIGISFLFGLVSAGIMVGGLTEATYAGLLATNWVAGSFAAMFAAILYAVSYHDLRVTKEGLDTNQIASVFD
jgi:hypothetical protein